MISYQYRCKRGHVIWIKHRHDGFQAQRSIRCFEDECGLKMKRTGFFVAKSGKKQFGKGSNKV